VIEKLKEKNLVDLVEFFDRVNDKYQDTYITLNKERIFLKDNWNLIKKLLKYQEIYAVVDKEIKGIMIILREKGFRPYIKLLAENRKYYYNLMMYLRFNFMDKELFAKLKNDNPLIEILQRKGFIKVGMRGKEILLRKQAIKENYKIIPKDNYLIDKEKKLY
jgi:hypothetical protein